MATFSGYPGQIWSACYQSIAWLAGVLQNGTTPAANTVAATQVTYNTLWNGLSALSVWQTAAALSSEQQNLLAIEALPLSLDPTTLSYLTTRTITVETTAAQLMAITPTFNPIMAATLLTAGQSAIPDPGFVEYCMAFNVEPVAVGTTTDQVIAQAGVVAQAWLTITNAVMVVQGASLTPAYDAAARMYRVSNMIYNILSSYTSGPLAASAPAGYDFLADYQGNVMTTYDGTTLLVLQPVSEDSTTYVWNQIVALPTVLMDAAVLNSSPYTFVSQECGIIRFVIGGIIAQLALYLLALRQPQLSQVNLAQVRQNDSLMDVAARNLGNFAEWSAIAMLNGINPPYPGPSNTALVGQNILLPGTNSVTVSGVSVPSYFSNVLGTDWDFGPINGTMPVWAGDYQTITGYQNFARALGRRIQTTLGTHVYHVDYGSRIPPEVGATQSFDEAAKIAQFGRAALASDPRTASVISATASLQPGFLAVFNGSVQPIGPGTTPVTINETISPLP